MLHFTCNTVMYFEPGHQHKPKISILKLATLLKLLSPIKSVKIKMITSIITGPGWSTVGVRIVWTWASPIWILFMRRPNLLQYLPKKTFSPFKWFPMTNPTRLVNLPSRTMHYQCWIACSMLWTSKNKKKHLMTFSPITTTVECFKTLFMPSVDKLWTSQSQHT